MGGCVSLVVGCVAPVTVGCVAPVVGCVAPVTVGCVASVGECVDAGGNCVAVALLESV